MSQEELIAEVARCTNEDKATIGRFGFSLLTFESPEEFEDSSPEVIDWDDWSGVRNNHGTCVLEALMD